MRGNIITLRMAYGCVAQAGDLWQYDYGQRLIISGVELPHAYEVHFANAENGTSKTVIGDDTGADIPDEFLLTGDRIHVWIYLHNGEDDGETVYHGIINVVKRAKPTDAEPTPVQQSEIDHAIAALNAGISTVEEIVEGIPQTIDDALADAKASGEFDGEPGQPGAPGDPGVSPSVSVDTITGGHEVTITDASGDHSFNVMDGAKGDPGTPGDPTELIDDTSTTATDKVWSAKKSADECSELSQAISQKYSKPASGIPASDLASGVIPSVPVTDVQVNGTSILSQGVANVPVASTSEIGVIKIASGYGLMMRSSPNDEQICIDPASYDQIKAASASYKPVTPAKQHSSVFYGLASAAGDSTQSASSNAVGVYTENAKSAIYLMLDAPETVSGTTPTITAKSGVRYVCGEVATLTITAPASGCIDVTFTSGSTPTVLTVTTAKTGATLKWANGFDPTSLDANTVYEINILDGEYGVVGSWT